MIFKLHYWFLTSGACAIGILMGVFVETYTDASSLEIGTLYMLMPFLGIIFRPIICSMADRKQAHQRYIIICLFITAISYSPFVVIPFLGPSVYKDHGRLCWYTLFVLKIIGDVAFGGVISIGDSLAINYANRIGTDFSVYRVWGTLSWMTFGMIIGQINEIWFLPKYVPGFMILIMSTLLDMTVIWLWPPEYFIMVAKDHGKKEQIEKEQQQVKKEKAGKLDALTKSLMPKEVVWAHIKGKLWSLVPFSSCCSTLHEKNHHQQQQQQQQALNQTNHQHLQFNSKLPSQFCSETKCSGLAITFSSNGKTTNWNEKDSFNTLNDQLAVTTTANKQSSENEEKEKQIDKMTQIRILAMLLKKDLRISLYLVFFVCAGMSMVPVGFFFMSLSKICHEQGTCEFSQLGGMIQASMALCETILFIYVKRIKAITGRVNLCAISLFLVSVKYLFYGTIWIQVSPYYSLIFEGIQGVIFGSVLTLMVELGHEFANEVEFLVPELMHEGVVKDELEAEKLKISLSATMQAVISSANDGMGRGIGALIYGLVLEKYSFETLWFIIGISATICCLITILISSLDQIFHFQLGLAEKEQLRAQQHFNGLDLEDLSRKESFSSQKTRNSLTNSVTNTTTR